MLDFPTADNDISQKLAQSMSILDLPGADKEFSQKFAHSVSTLDFLLRSVTFHKKLPNFYLRWTIDSDILSRKGPDTVRSLSAGQRAQSFSPIVWWGENLIYTFWGRLLSFEVSLAGRDTSDGVRPLSWLWKLALWKPPGCASYTYIWLFWLPMEYIYRCW